MDTNIEIAYWQKCTDIVKLTKKIVAKLEDHGTRFEKSRRQDWGYVGELNHVEFELAEVLRFLENK